MQKERGTIISRSWRGDGMYTLVGTRALFLRRLSVSWSKQYTECGLVYMMQFAKNKEFLGVLRLEYIRITGRQCPSTLAVSSHAPHAVSMGARAGSLMCSIQAGALLCESGRRFRRERGAWSTPCRREGNIEFDVSAEVGVEGRAARYCVLLL